MKTILKILFIFYIFLPFFCFANNDHILISEIQISGDTSTDEYIKIYNSLDEDVNLYGYKIIKKTTTGNQYNLVSNFSETSIIKAKSYFTIAHKDYSSYGYGGGVDFYYTNNSYSISKDNSLYLINNNLEAVDLVGFGICFEKEGEVCLNNLDNYQIYRRKNNIDTDSNILDFEMINLNNDVLVINNEENQIVNNEQIIVNEPILDPVEIFYQKDIVFSEIYPNPITGEDEFIEIKNIGKTPIDLNNYKIKDNSNRIFSIKNIILKEDDVYAFFKDNTGISLNNIGEEHLYLLTPDNEIIQHLIYYDSKYNNSYAIGDIGYEYFWTKVKTPMEKNIIEKENILPTIDCKIPKSVFINIAFNVDCSDSYDEDGDKIFFKINMGDNKEFNNSKFYFRYIESGKYIIKIDVFDERGSQNSAEYKISVNNNLKESGFFIDDNIEKNDDCIEINTNELQEVDIGSCVIVASNVIATPNILNEKYFYINGAQIYFYEHNFPDLKNGDFVKIRGEISSNRLEKRIKITKKEDIEIIKHDIKEEFFNAYNNYDFEFNIAKLVVVEGEIISKTKNHIILKNLDEEYDVYINDKLGIVFDNIKRGDGIEVIGIVNKINDKFRIILRKFEDVQKKLDNVGNKNNFNMAIVHDDNSYGYAIADNFIEQGITEYVIDINNKKRILLICGGIVFVVIVLIFLFILIKRMKK